MQSMDFEICSMKTLEAYLSNYFLKHLLPFGYKLNYKKCWEHCKRTTILHWYNVKGKAEIASKRKFKQGNWRSKSAVVEYIGKCKWSLHLAAFLKVIFRICIFQRSLLLFSLLANSVLSVLRMTPWSTFLNSTFLTIEIFEPNLT